MKKHLRIISTVLAVLMLILALPLTVIAKSLAVMSDELNPILKLDDLADTDNDLNNGYNVDTAKIHKSNTQLDGEKILRTAEPADGYWTYAIATNIPLSETSEYTTNRRGVRRFACGSLDCNGKAGCRC